MKKCFLLLLILLCKGSISMAQSQYWEHQDIDFNYGVRVMYYDSVTEKSYIGGSFTKVDGDSCKLLVYDGQSYTPISPPLPVGVGNVKGMVRYRDKLYVCGEGLASWDGNAWDVIDIEAMYTNLRVYNDKLYALGIYNPNSNSTIILQGSIRVWNDTVWTGLLGIDSILSNPSNAVSDIAFYKGNVYVGGNWHNEDKPHLSDLMMHDGQSWKPVGNWWGSGMGGAEKLLVWRDTLYVAGMFLESPYMPGNCIAAWDGQAWHRLQAGVRAGSEASSAIFDVNVYNDELWVAGFFSTINGRYVHNDYGKVAKWDGSQWCTMDTWLKGGAYGIGRWKDELFIQGTLSFPNDFSKRAFFKWTGGSYTDTCTQTLSVNINPTETNEIILTVYPVPAKDKIFVALPSISLGSSVRVSLTDALGRYSKTEHQNVVNSTLEINLSALPAGVYYLNLNDNNIKGTAKFVKL